jgi:hypothetical protein
VPFSKQVLCAALAAGCVLGTTAAEARFGRSGGGASSGSHGSDGNGSGPRVHDATPVGWDSDSGSSTGHGGGNGRPRTPRRTALRPGWYSPHVFIGAAHSYPYRPRRWEREQPEERGPGLLVRLGVEGFAVKDGGALGGHLGIEGRHWGFSTRLTSLGLSAEDGSGGRDRIQLGEVNLTFAPVASKHGRLRLEAGVAAARAPDITFIGPSVALSFERCLFGPLDVEGRLQWVPVPHVQLDGQAALALHLGVLTLRGGWRGLLLNDKGYIEEGVEHQDVMGGPFAGLGFNF